MTADHAAIRARLDAITPGPWYFNDTSDSRAVKGEFRSRDGGHNGFMLVGTWVNDADPEFIAHAPEHMRALLAENETLLAVIAAVKAAWWSTVEHDDQGSYQYTEAVEAAMDTIWFALSNQVQSEAEAGA